LPGFQRAYLVKTEFSAGFKVTMATTFQMGAPVLTLKLRKAAFMARTLPAKVPSAKVARGPPYKDFLSTQLAFSIA